MDQQLPPPDLAISLYPDLCAPRAARYCVGTIEPPPPQLRDNVVLLTSELVSRAVRLHAPSSQELFELRIWMGGDVARVELRAPRELVCATPAPESPQDDLRLIDIFADRWSIDADGQDACIWFELDCHPGEQELNGGRRSRSSSGALGSRFPRARAWARRRRSCLPASPLGGAAFRRYH